MQPSISNKHFIVYLLTWLLLFVAGFINGTIREFVYKSYVGELTAHQISTFTLIIFITAIVWFVYRRYPLENYRQCVMIGITWMILTAAWEFVFGHYVMGHPWERLLFDYRIRDGRIWVLVILWMGWVTVFVHRMKTRPGQKFSR
ncbi:hypothetical protein JNL27_13755 [bacterium]|nr:hypothetical protein [bacterium]